MPEKNLSFFEMFAPYRPDPDLAAVLETWTVTGAVIDRASRSIRVDLLCPEPPDSALLRQAESEFSPHLFFGQRRKIARHCVRGRLTGWYEIASFQSDAWQEVKDDNSSFHQGCVAFHPLDGTVAIRYDRSGLIEFREDTGRPTGSLRLPDNGFDYRNGLNSLCYSPSGDRLAVGGENAVLLLETGLGPRAETADKPAPLPCHSGAM